MGELQEDVLRCFIVMQRKKNIYRRLSNVSSILKVLIIPKCKQLHEKHTARATKKHALKTELNCYVCVAKVSKQLKQKKFSAGKK